MALVISSMCVSGGWVIERLSRRSVRDDVDEFLCAKSVTTATRCRAKTDVAGGPTTHIQPPSHATANLHTRCSAAARSAWRWLPRRPWKTDNGWLGGRLSLTRRPDSDIVRQYGRSASLTHLLLLLLLMLKYHLQRQRCFASYFC